MRKKQFLHFRS